jgi:hypothetical protein
MKVFCGSEIFLSMGEVMTIFLCKVYRISSASLINNTGILAATSSARPAALSVFDEFAIVKSETFHISYENALQFY